MKYQCAKCETIFEHEKYLTECDGEKTCPICDTMEVVYKLSNRFEQQVIPKIADTKLLDLLKDANEICRSAYSIAERNGDETNWEAFRNRLKPSLEKQHKIIYPPSNFSL